MRHRFLFKLCVLLEKTIDILVFFFSRTPSLIKSHLLKQNNNNETSPQASPRSTPKLSVDSTTTALEAVKNGRVEEPKPAKAKPLAQPSPGVTQVLIHTVSLIISQLMHSHQTLFAFAAVSFFLLFTVVL